MEIATGVPNFEQFVVQYNNNVDKYPDIIVLQGHPNGYDELKLEELKKIITFLKGKKCEFILPYDFYTQNNNLRNK